MTQQDFITQFQLLYPNSPLPIFPSQPNPIPQPSQISQNPTPQLSQNYFPSPNQISQPSQNYFSSPNQIPQPSQNNFSLPNPKPQASQTYFSSQYQTPQPSQIYTPQPSQQTQTDNNAKGKGKKPVVVKQEKDCSKNWDTEEDVTLCDIVSNVSDRPTQLRKGKFWNIIVDEYNEAMKHHFNYPRDVRSCQNRWASLKKVAIAWKAATERVERENRSGENQLDAYTRKKLYYNGLQKGKDIWRYEHIEHHLLNFSRYSWRTTAGAYKTFDDVFDISSPRVSSQGSAKRSNPFDDDEDDKDEDEGPNEVYSPVKIISRPEGVKKTKAKAKVARDIFYDSENSAHAERIAEARRLEAQADMAKTEYARERFALKHQLKQRQQDENYLMYLFARAKTDEDFAQANEVQKKFNAKYWS